jgi:hypothetical protein
MTAEVANKVFECDIHYLTDNTADVIWPEDWPRRCIPEPHWYEIHKRVVWEKEVMTLRLLLLIQNHLYVPL